MAMASSKVLLSFLLISLVLAAFAVQADRPRRLFAEYIGAEFNGVKFSDVPINPDVNFHFILAFAIDYTTSPSHPTPTNGHFSAFWDTDSLSPPQVALIKRKHGNVRVSVSLAGDSVTEKGIPVYFHANSAETWVRNAVSSLTRIIKQYHLDGIDIDYEHFHSTPALFADCIGGLITTLKKNGVISFASIAPYDDGPTQSHYLALWKKYGHVIDYVNFQFYSYDKGTTVPQFLGHFNTLSSQYDGGKLLASFGTDNSGGLKPDKGFFRACRTLKSQGKLHGIAIWSADDTKKYIHNFRYETQAQQLLAS